MRIKNCPICKTSIYSGAGKGCMMCGMPLKDEGKSYCSKRCRKLYRNINN